MLLAASTIACFAIAGCGDDDASEPTSATATSTASTSTPSAPAGDDLTVEVEPSVAAPGSTLQATVRNGTEKQFTYGAAYEIDRAISGPGEMWEPVDLPARAVIEIAYVAPPGESGAAVEVEVPDDLETGLYRVVIARDVPNVGDLVGEFEISDD